MFVLCMERLGHIINTCVADGRWKPIRVGRAGPLLSHLMFADDLLLYAEASLEQLSVIQGALHTFCEAAGQKVNPSKTMLYFSRNVPGDVRLEIQRAAGFKASNDLRKYLGVPLLHGRMSKTTYAQVLNKVRNKLEGWAAASLSLAGRVSLINAAAMSIPM